MEVCKMLLPDALKNESTDTGQNPLLIVVELIAKQHR
jgi:hypothetical protein